MPRFQQGGPIPHKKPGEGSDAPPTLKRSGSERRGGAVTSLALLERARAWEWVKDPLFARGGQGSRKKHRAILQWGTNITFSQNRKVNYL